MVKRARKAKAQEAPANPSAARPAVRVLLTLAVAAAVLFGLSWAGVEARRQIGPRDRYAVPFGDIQVDPPPGSTREAFLAEVRYASAAAPTVQALDSELSAKLTTAFAAHPWVAGVDGVSVEGTNAVSVRLTYRVPALAVGGRAVDAKGILLPATAPTAGLPDLLDAAPPEVPAGKPVSDDVARAAAVASEYKPRSIVRAPQGWQLVMPDGKKLSVAR